MFTIPHCYANFISLRTPYNTKSMSVIDITFEDEIAINFLNCFEFCNNKTAMKQLMMT